MAKKNQEGSIRDASRKTSPVNVKKVSSPINIQNGPHRMSSNRLSPSISSTGSSLRSSPGLLAGHFAGCKWSETPLPSALPKPPSHWMSSSEPSMNCSFFREASEQIDVSYQLKMLLKVQA